MCFCAYIKRKRSPAAACQLLLTMAGNRSRSEGAGGDSHLVSSFQLLMFVSMFATCCMSLQACQGQALNRLDSHTHTPDRHACSAQEGQQPFKDFITSSLISPGRSRSLWRCAAGIHTNFFIVFKTAEEEEEGEVRTVRKNVQRQGNMWAFRLGNLSETQD